MVTAQEKEQACELYPASDSNVLVTRMKFEAIKKRKEEFEACIPNCRWIEL